MRELLITFQNLKGMKQSRMLTKCSKTSQLLKKLQSHLTSFGKISTLPQHNSFGACYQSLLLQSFCLLVCLLHSHQCQHQPLQTLLVTPNQLIALPSMLCSVHNKIMKTTQSKISFTRMNHKGQAFINAFVLLQEYLPSSH